MPKSRTEERPEGPDRGSRGDITRSKSESDFLLTPSEAWQAEHRDDLDARSAGEADKTSRESIAPSVLQDQLKLARPRGHSTRAPSVATTATLTPLEDDESQKTEERKPKRIMERPSMRGAKSVSEVRKQLEGSTKTVPRHSSGVNPEPLPDGGFRRSGPGGKRGSTTSGTRADDEGPSALHSELPKGRSNTAHSEFESASEAVGLGTSHPQKPLPQTRELRVTSPRVPSYAATLKYLPVEKYLPLS